MNTAKNENANILFWYALFAPNIVAKDITFY